VALPLKWKKRSWMVTGHPTDRLVIGRILQFGSTPPLGERVKEELYELIELHTVVQGYALLMDSSVPCLNRRIISLRDEVRQLERNNHGIAIRAEPMA
ncbi:hypothetical protein Tco_1323224, partial [Tanacetum coccineum]